MSSERSDRIVQIMPLACPLWGVYGVDDPDTEGYHYWCERIHGLALTEDWIPARESDQLDYHNRDRSIHPIYLEDGTYFDVPDLYGSHTGVITIIDALPVTRDERDALERQVVRELTRRADAKVAADVRRLAKAATGPQRS